jgi:hypothetical protein
MTVGELLARISSAELTEWMAFDAIDPFGEERADLRAGIIASVTANHSFAPPSKPRQPSDYMLFHVKQEPAPLFDPDPEKQSKLIKRMVFGVKD